jgi:hypothetical protein
MCPRRFQQWVEAGVFTQLAQGLAGDLITLGERNFEEWFIDGTVARAAGYWC